MKRYPGGFDAPSISASKTVPPEGNRGNCTNALCCELAIRVMKENIFSKY